MKYKIVFFSSILAALIACPVLPARAGSAIATGAAVVPPSGFIHFCVKHSDECLVSGHDTARMELTAARQAELREVQARINEAIEPREDPSHLWEYARDGHGDCNTFALTKRRALIALGWPEETLLLAAVYTERNEGHLVLVARTSQGDLVLDNRLPRIVEWTVLPYRWVSMQSQASPARWLRVTGESVATADSGQNTAVALR
jgi:predicted transglutaminase-like cysteine proteinase